MHIYLSLSRNLTSYLIIDCLQQQQKPHLILQSKHRLIHLFWRKKNNAWCVWLFWSQAWGNLRLLHVKGCHVDHLRYLLPLCLFMKPHTKFLIIPCHTSWHTHTQPSQVWIKPAVYQSRSQICSDQIPLSEKVIFFRLLPDVYLKALFSFLSSFSRNSVRVWCILVNIPSNEDTLRQTHPEMLHVCCSLPQGR